MVEQPELLEDLIRRLTDLPGVGRRSAERIAFHLLASPVKRVTELARAIHRFRTNMRPCRICNNLSAREICSICADPGRERDHVLVVEYPADVQAFEHTGEWKGLYHVLMGRVAPMAGIEPGDLSLDMLMKRIADAVKDADRQMEIVIATSSTVEGEATAGLVIDGIASLPNADRVHVSRIAVGLPSGSEVSFAQSGTLRQALSGRKEISSRKDREGRS